MNRQNIRDNYRVYYSDDEEFGRIQLQNGRPMINGQELPDRYIARIDKDRVYLTEDARTYFSSQSQTVQGQTTEREVRVPVVEERLVAGTRPVEAGYVEVEKRIREEQQSIPVETRQERAQIERREINPDRPLTEAEAAQAFKEGTIRVPLRGEQVVAAKETVATGEVVVTKEEERRRQDVTGTVRREEVEVQEHMDKQYEQMKPVFEEHFNQRAATTGQTSQSVASSGQTSQRRTFAEAEPNYRLGYQAGTQHRGRKFDEIEPQLRQSYQGNDPWDRLREEVREGFNRANR